MLSLHKKKSPHTTECMALHVVIMFVMLIMTLVAGLGVYMSHVTSQGLLFGSATGSLAILAFVASLMIFFKSLKACMSPCEVCMTNGKK